MGAALFCRNLFLYREFESHVLFYMLFSIFKHFEKVIGHFMIKALCTQSNSCTRSKAPCTRSDLAVHALTSLHTFQPRCTRFGLAAHVPTSLHTLQPRCTRSLRILNICQIYRSVVSPRYRCKSMLRQQINFSINLLISFTTFSWV